MNKHAILTSSLESELFVISIPRLQRKHSFHLLSPSLPYHVLERESSYPSTYHGQITYISSNYMLLDNTILVISNCLYFNDYLPGDNISLQSIHLLSLPWIINHIQYQVLLVCSYSSVSNVLQYHCIDNYLITSFYSTIIISILFFSFLTIIIKTIIFLSFSFKSMPLCYPFPSLS